MKKLITALLLLPLSGWALPLLQLDVVGGIYNTLDETIYAPATAFDLVALYDGTPPSPPSPLTAPESAASTDTSVFYVSAAIVPQVGETVSSAPSADFGSFTIDGTVYSYANSNMFYGGPPVDSLFPDLPYHGIFATWYAEIAFRFDPPITTTAYNSQDNPGGLVILGPGESGAMHYHLFNVDASGLNPGFAVHFDLYDQVIKQKKKQTDYSLNFAPFSHDAQSNFLVLDSTSTAGLISLALAALGLAGRRSSRRK